MERAPATRSRSSPPSVSEREKRHWQNIRGMEIPSENQVQNIRYCDHALGNHVLHRLELPKEEVYDTLRGEMELAVDDEGHATDQQLLDFQKHVEQSIREPLHDPALKRERWADMFDESGEIPLETTYFPGGALSLIMKAWLNVQKGPMILRMHPQIGE